LLNPPPADRWLPFIWLSSRSSRRYQRGPIGPRDSRQRAVVIDSAGNLLSWTSPGCHQWVTRESIDSKVLAFSYIDSASFVYLRARGRVLEVVLWTPQQSIWLDAFATSAPPRRAHLRGQMVDAQWRGAWCAAESTVSPTNASDAWICRESTRGSSGFRASQICVPPGSESIGISCDSTLHEARYSVLAISQDRNHLLSIGPSRSATIFSSTTKIASASAATDSDLVALLTEAEDLVVLGGNGQELFRWNPAKMG
jgi:hypothetical protein